MTRVALYSHDSLGLGHVRRSLAIARSLSLLPSRPDVLLVSGAREAGLLPRPAGCDIVGLPGVAKTRSGRYAARDLHGLDLVELRSLRSSVAAAALVSFAPDLLVVDRHPLGFGGELEATLRALPAHTAVVLGLRDVLDEPHRAAAEWADAGCVEALEQFYDEVWVYGDPAVYDLTHDVPMPTALRGRVRFTGYLAHGREEPLRPVPHGARREATRVLGLVGAGSDGAELARTFVDAAALHGQPSSLVLGPQMPEAERTALHSRAARVAGLEVHDFATDMAPVLDRAAAVVCMGGYNTACEVLDRGLPALMVPRVTPRREQLVRATALDHRGLVTMRHPHGLGPASVAAWVATATSGQDRERAGIGDRSVPAERADRPVRPGPSRGSIDLDGLSRVRALAAELVAGRPTGSKEVHRVAV